MHDHRKVDSYETLRPYVDQVVKAIGIAGPAVTETTRLNCYYRNLDGGQYIEEVNHLHGLLGVVVQCGDYVMDIAERVATQAMPAPTVEELVNLRPFK